MVGVRVRGGLRRSVRRVRGAKRRERGTYFRPLVHDDRASSAPGPRRRPLPGRGFLSPPGHRTRWMAAARASASTSGPTRRLAGAATRFPPCTPSAPAPSVRRGRGRCRQPGFRSPPIMTEEPASGWLVPRSHPSSSHPRPGDSTIDRARPAPTTATGRRRAGAWRPTRRPSTGRWRRRLRLKALTIFWRDRRVISAGVPGTLAFGRDALSPGSRRCSSIGHRARCSLVPRRAPGPEGGRLPGRGAGKSCMRSAAASWRAPERCRNAVLRQHRRHAAVHILYTEYLRWNQRRAFGVALLPRPRNALRWIENSGDKGRRRLRRVPAQERARPAQPGMEGSWTASRTSTAPG